MSGLESVPGAQPLVTYVGYTVSGSNDGGNTINNLLFTGGTTVTDGAELAVFDSAEGASCVTTNVAKTAISCTIGQLSAGNAFPTFAVFFKAPAKVVNGVADAAGADFINFSGKTFYADGSPTPGNSILDWTPTTTLLGTSNPSVIKSTVPKAGGFFYTGEGGVATPTDPLTTTVKVPSRATYTTAEVSESTIPVSCSPNPAFCFATELTIPGLDFAYLEITLRRDASTIVKGAKIEDAKLFYSSDPLPALGTPIGPCNVDGTIPDGDRRCIAGRTAYTKKYVTDNGLSADFIGDWGFVVHAHENGRIAW